MVYASQANIEAHYNTTAREIFAEIKNIDYLFIGAGTTGTLMGCAKFFKEFSPKTKIIAVDALGSTTFGFEAKKRYIPGIGTSRKPEICSTENIDEIILVDEKDAVKMCHEILQRYSLFLGGSSGSVLNAIKEYCAKIPPDSTIVTLSPDFGEKYIDTVYNQDWLDQTLNI